MNLGTTTDVYYDPYDVEIYFNPYPVFRRLREEAPLYYNEPHDFYAVSRFDDVERGLINRETFISGRGAILELIKANLTISPGVAPVRGPARAHRAPGLVVTGVHAEAGRRARAKDPSVLRPEPRPAHRNRAGRFRCRPRRPDADANDRHAARHSGTGPGGDPRPRRRDPAH